MKLVHFIKNLGKQKLIICSLAMLFVISGSVCIHLNSELHHWKGIAANENMDTWYTLRMITSLYDEQSDVESAIKGNYLFSNGVLHWAVTDLSPAFPEHFLTTDYDSFMRDITKFEGESKEKALELFKEINSELLNICIYVEENFESPKAKLELIDSDSNSYKTVEKKIQNFYDTYHKKIRDFYDENTYLNAD